MTTPKRRGGMGVLLCSLGLILGLPTQASAEPQKESTGTQAEPASAKRKIDRSGKPRRGKASYYAKKFAGRTMADGTPMDPDSNIAASRTLPLGTKARVTNLENGKSAVVEIRDRGPYVDGRIIDLTPRTARKLEFHKDGIAPVVVTPIEIPKRPGEKPELVASGD